MLNGLDHIPDVLQQRDTVFVTFKVNNTVILLVTTTNMTGSDTAIVVTTTRLVVFLKQWCVRFALVKLRVNHFNDVATARDVGLHLTIAIVLYSSDLLSAADEVQILAFLQGDVSFFQSLRRPKR